MSSDLLISQLSNFLSFSNGKTSPDRDKNSKFPVYGSNGIIGYSAETNATSSTIIIGRVGSYCGSIHFSKSPCWVSDNAIICVSNNSDESLFWYYYLQQAQLNNYRSGSGQPLLNQSTLKSIDCRVPKLSSLRVRIGEMLSMLDSKISLNQQLNQTLEQIAQAIFKSWFVDYEPVKAKIAALEAGGGEEDALFAAIQAISGKDAAQLAQLQAEHPYQYTELRTTAELFPSAMQDSELGEIPKGWSVKPFSKIARLDTTSVKPNSNPGKVWEHYSIPAFDAAEHPSLETGQEIKSSKYKVDANAILSSKLNPHFPRTWIPKVRDSEAAICSTEFMQFIPLNEKLRPFAANMIKSAPFQAGILMRVTGSTGSRQRAQPKQVALMEVVHPPKALQVLFSTETIAMYEQQAFAIQQSHALAAIRDTLLPKLLSGDLVPNDRVSLTEITS